MGYSLAARFTSATDARKAYGRVVHGLSDSTPLSATVFHSPPWWIVALVGEETDLKVFARLAVHLTRTGKIISLPDEIHDQLLAQRAQRTTPSVPHLSRGDILRGRGC